VTKIDNYSPSQLVPLPRITEALLDRIEQHLDAIIELQDLPILLQAGERAMLARLRTGNTTKYDIEFYLHELIEAAKFKQTGDLKQAHEQALKFRKVTERDLFHPDVIAQYSELFPCNWRI
jgi:hypothetical protein